MVNLMDRNELIKETCKKNFTCEILIIGGGATGLGVAVDAASRGYSVILLEQSDFAKGLPVSSLERMVTLGFLKFLRP